MNLAQSVVSSANIILQFVATLLTARYIQNKYDVLVIPGGAKGAATISKSPAVQSLIRDYIDAGKIVGMICAGAIFPSVCIEKSIFINIS